ncbi:MAG: hypothetical protein JKY08_02095 [Flavobacteriaceae bacterium]|nr:hypothetical protein [Flavobacteriaceae bacterium]
MKLKFIFFCLLGLNIVSCKEKFSGTSDEEFKSSRIEVMKDLTSIEEEKLEKAFRVVALYAMEEKWNNSDKYIDKSINEISLDVINNKTYDNLVNFAEDFLKQENEGEIKKIEIKISEIELNRKKADSVITLLKAFKPTEIKIIKGIWDEPTISVKIINKSSLTEITEYLFDLTVYSISQNKKIDRVVSGSNYKEGKLKGEDDFFAYISRSLSPIIENSKRLQKQLQNPKYPITNLKEYDLRIEVKPYKIVLKNGTKYVYPKKTLADYNTEIKILQAQLKTLNSTLDELALKEMDIENEKSYNEEFLFELKEIRKIKYKSEERILKINKNITFTFPSRYEIKKQNSVGMYALSLSNSLSFDNSDENLIQYQIRDTTYIEYEDNYDKANGVLNVLKKETATYYIKETIDVLKTTNYYKLIDTDETGYIYVPHSDMYRLLRYLKINDTHYLYSMDFKNLNECVREFDRSKGLIK